MAVALLALFVALGGTGYAAIVLPKNSVGTKQIKPGAVSTLDIRRDTIRSSDVHTRTLTGDDIRRNAITDKEIKESTLATVPRASVADTLNGFTAFQLKVTCPTGTIAASATCIESSSRPAQSFGLGNSTCFLAGRRLATYPELKNFLDSQHPVAPGGEWTANVGESSTTAGQLVATVILTNGGSSVEFINATGATQRAFRCAARPSN